MIGSIRVSRRNQRVTLNDIAKHAQVGVATVDRVLNRRAPVSKATAARVLSAAEQLGYHANHLIRRRVEEMAPAVTLGFVLQKESKWFYQSLAAQIRHAASELLNVRATVRLTFVDSLAPSSLASAIEDMAASADAIGLVAIDHPQVVAAVDQSAEAGRPVFALLSPLNAAGVSGYVGIEGRKAGRTAGWAMTKLSPAEGEVAVLIGSHRYLGHEALETGFRSYMQAYAPATRLRDSLVYLDDSAIAYEAASELLQTNKALAGLYHCGGGVSGVVRALEESGRARDVAYICHEGSPHARRALVDGTIDLALVTPIEQIARTVTAAMATRITGRQKDYALAPIPFEILSPENL